MSANNLSTNELLDRYLSGAITAPQEAELERRAASDPVLVDALLGLQAFPEADHMARIEQMVAQAAGVVEPQPQVQGKDQEAKVRPIGRYLAAASVLLLLAVAVFLLPRFTQNAAGDLAMKVEAPETEVALPTNNQNEDGAADIAPIEEETLEETVPPTPTSAEAITYTPAPVTRNETPALNPTIALTPEPAAAAPQATATGQASPQAPVVDNEELPELAEDQELEAPAPSPPVTPITDEDLAAGRIAREAAEKAAVERRKRMAPPTPNPQLPTDNPQPTTVSGRITDERGEPIVGALVRLPGLPIGERTDTNGVFTLDTDATTSRIDISHPDFEEESFDIRNQLDDIQLSLEDKEQKDYRDWTDSWAAVKVPISNEPGYALPEEGYTALRKRIEANKPADVPAGKFKLSFTVNPDGTLEDFVFKGRPSQETMDYIGGTIARTSIWNVMKGDKPVRVYFKVVFE